MALLGTNLLATVFTVMHIIVLCKGNPCPISLPQDVSRDSPCGKQREESLTKQRGIFGIEEPSAALPFSHLAMSSKDYRAFLSSNPFLGLHAALWGAQANLTLVLPKKYLIKTASFPKVMKLPEFAPLWHLFRETMEKYFDGYAEIPSDTEPFQRDMTKWISDEQFADQRLAGINPMTLQKVTFSKQIGTNWNDLKKKLNQTFNWNKAVRRVLKKSLRQAIMRGYMFVLHHGLSDNITPVPDIAESDPHRKMWDFTSPIALFVSVPGKCFNSEPRLMPLAIQMDSTPDSKVFTPKDGDLWILAKLSMQLTDFETSQITEHLCKAHFVTEALCLSIERQLSNRHPFYEIMQFHCRGIFTLDKLGLPIHLAPNRTFHKMFAYGYQGPRHLVRETAKILHWKDLELKSNIKKRGLNDYRRLPYYPYRDDGFVILKAIRNMIRDYVNTYYDCDFDVKEDSEMQNFVNEASADGTGPNGGKGKIRGFPAKIETKIQLINTFTQMIWLMSGQHSAINYPLVDYGAYPPNIPLKLYDDDRVSSTKFSGARLGNRKQAAIQAAFAVSIATHRYDRLFDYGEFLDDPEARQVLYRHFSVLTEKVEPLLNKRNAKRLQDGHLTYPYMLPRWLPNGIQT